MLVESGVISGQAGATLVKLAFLEEQLPALKIKLMCMLVRCAVAR